MRGPESASGALAGAVAEVIGKASVPQVHQPLPEIKRDAPRGQAEIADDSPWELAIAALKTRYRVVRARLKRGAP
jgi:hypothetical protein